MFKSNIQAKNENCSISCVRTRYGKIELTATFRQPFDLLAVTNTTWQREKAAGNVSSGLPKFVAPQVGLEPTTLRLKAECSAIELLRRIWWRSPYSRWLLS